MGGGLTIGCVVLDFVDIDIDIDGWEVSCFDREKACIAPMVERV